MEFYLAIKKKEIVSFAGNGWNWTPSIMLSEIK
jgi:hypothetical protein